jgi:hypothetical protein
LNTNLFSNMYILSIHRINNDILDRFRWVRLHNSTLCRGEEDDITKTDLHGKT